MEQVLALRPLVRRLRLSKVFSFLAVLFLRILLAQLGLLDLRNLVSCVESYILSINFVLKVLSRLV